MARRSSASSTDFRRRHVRARAALALAIATGARGVASQRTRRTGWLAAPVATCGARLTTPPRHLESAARQHALPLGLGAALRRHLDMCDDGAGRKTTRRGEAGAPR